MKKILSIIIFAVLATALIALVVLKPQSKFEKIEGAFGLKLGDVFDVTAKGTDSFTPQTPTRSFDRYFVHTTPKSRRIHHIGATADFSSKSDLEKERFAILELLISKYGPLDDEKRESGKGNQERPYSIYSSIYPNIIIEGSDLGMEMWSITRNNRRILVITGKPDDVTYRLGIDYDDMDLLNLSQKESIDIKASKAASEGL